MSFRESSEIQSSDLDFKLNAMIRENLLEIKKKLPRHVTLVAVSKTKPVSDLMQAYDAGQRVFGENKIQEMVAKADAMPKDIEWHMIGHVQTNKVKFMAPFVSLIHGVDSLKLLAEINKEAAKNKRIIDCLLQVHIATEQTKFGLNHDELTELLNSEQFKNMTAIRIRGLMGMASFSSDKNQIKTEFSGLKAIFDGLQTFVFTDNFNPQILSMGMSGDFNLAIECGSTMVRIGSSIFGSRN